MGFAPIVTAAGMLAGKAMEASAQRQQARAYQQLAQEKMDMARQQAGVITSTALANQQRGQRNAHMQMASARADAAASNLLREGSTLRREEDMATRLEDEISNTTNRALQEANDTRLQGVYDNKELRLMASHARRNSQASLVGGIAGAMGALSSGRR